MQLAKRPVLSPNNKVITKLDKAEQTQEQGTKQDWANN